MFRYLFAVHALLAFGVLEADAQDVDYLRDIKPVLRERCYACHGALKQEASLRLDTAAAIRGGGENGPVVMVGNAAESTLIARVSSADDIDRMPPEGKPLTPEQIALLRAWIDSGAAPPADEQPEPDPDRHWAFLPPQRPALPSAEDRGKPVNPIDALLTAHYRMRGVTPVEPADKRLLLRRASLDLIGLPPTRAELEAFMSDSRPDAWDRVVDKLLASPHYGERWGRHWMDVWRYTDWYGLGQQLRNSQKHLWHWRDWIIESLNADKGYDRMLREMLAADELFPTDRDVLRATGFLARNYYLFNRTTWLDDTIEHTSKAFLGLTINCSKCHDHKYDPITQEDYYRLRAFFEPHQVRLDALPGETDLEKNGLPRVFDAHPDAPTYLHIRGNDKEPDTSRAILPGVPGVLSFEELHITPVELPAEAHNPALQEFVRDDHLRTAEAEIAAAESALRQARQQLTVAEEADRRLAGQEKGARDIASGELVWSDDFDQAQPDLWETGPGVWNYANGLLSQSQTGAARAFLRSKKLHPPDFVATLTFRTLGGQQWKSVGLCFDVAEEREKLVYLSAVQPGSKLQISYKTSGNHAYPADAKQDRTVELRRQYVLRVAVRDRLVNVAVDGEHALAYELPVKRELGRFEIVAFDAAVEFDALELRTLPMDVPLAPAAVGPQSKPPTVAAARAAVDVAEKTLAAAQLKPDAIRSAYAADRAKMARASAADDAAGELVQQAVLSARRYDHAQAAVQVAAVEQKLATLTDPKQQPQIEKELTAARTNLERAQEKLEQPTGTYMSLRASLKALEGPAETAASRDQPYPTISTGRRTALAQWMTDARNPLTARVAVNHMWMRHFGQPLVESVTDFGRRAPPPPLQDVLDWLAIELMENQWSMKHLHRLIVTSRVYRLQSTTFQADAATLKRDPENHYFWRREPLRMESQVVRDSLLHLAGVLNPQIGGATVDPQKNDTDYRRSLYFTHSRDGRHRFLAMFDDADIAACYRRSESIVPQQALTLANSRLALTMARQLTARLHADLGDVDDAEFIHAAFQTILCVEPTPEELVACQEALREIRSLPAERRGADPAGHRARENLVHALFNHNDFITIR